LSILCRRSSSRRMVSSAKLRANRLNARASTGPRTRAGKAISARNALRHGLTLPIVIDDALAAEVERLKLIILTPNASLAQQQLAPHVAIAQLDVDRIQRVRDRLCIEYFSKAEQVASRIDGADQYASILSKLRRKLSAINRYERRAFSRLNSAIGAFDEPANRLHVVSGYGRPLRGAIAVVITDTPRGFNFTNS
jgi:hypothetical protein